VPLSILQCFNVLPVLMRSLGSPEDQSSCKSRTSCYQTEFRTQVQQTEPMNIKITRKSYNALALSLNAMNLKRQAMRIHYTFSDPNAPRSLTKPLIRYHWHCQSVPHPHLHQPHHLRSSGQTPLSAIYSSTPYSSDRQAQRLSA